MFSLNVVWMTICLALIGVTKTPKLNEEVTQKKLSDRELLVAVKKAVDDKRTPESVEKTVGVKAVVNTAKKFGWVRLATLRIINDDLGEPLDKMKNVVIWLRPTTKTPKGYKLIVGIAWTRLENVIFFTAQAKYKRAF